LSGRGATR